MSKTLKVDASRVQEAIADCPESKCLLETLFPEAVMDDVQLVAEFSGTRIFKVDDFVVVEKNGAMVGFWDRADGGWFRVHAPHAEDGQQDFTLYGTGGIHERTPHMNDYHAKVKAHIKRTGG